MSQHLEFATTEELCTELLNRCNSGILLMDAKNSDGSLVHAVVGCPATIIGMMEAQKYSMINQLNAGEIEIEPGDYVD